MAKLHVYWDNQKGLLGRVGYFGTDIRTNAKEVILLAAKRGGRP